MSKKRSVCKAMRLLGFVMTMIVLLTSTSQVLPVVAAPYDADGEWRTLPIRSEDEARDGLAGGEGEQCMHAAVRCYEKPEYLYAAQDVTGVWRSTDSGNTWKHTNDEGLFVNYMFGLQVDPRNPDLLLALAVDPWNGGSEGTNLYEYQGIYRSTDGGDHWDFVKSVDLGIDWGSERRVYENIAFDYSAMDPTDTNATNWYVAIGGDYLYKSTDSGLTYTPVADLKAYSLVNAVKVDSQGQVYVQTEQQLLKMDMSQPNEAGLFDLNQISDLKINDSEKLVKRNNEGKVIEDTRVYLSYFEIDPNDDNVMYVALMARNYNMADANRVDGIYKSTNQGVTFDRILEYPACIVKVSPADSDVMYVISRLSMGQPMMVTHNGGVDWFRSPKDKYIPGDLGNSYKQGVCIESTSVMPHPTNPMEAAFYSQMAFWRTEDGGRSVEYTNTGFTGYAWTRNSAAAEFDPREQYKDRFGLFCCDVGTMITDNNGDWFERVMPSEAASWRANHFLSGTGTYAGAFCPEVGTPNEGVIVATIGQYERTQIMRSTDFGETWSLEHYYNSNDETQVADYLANLHRNEFIDFNPVRTNMVIASNGYSLDYGATFMDYDFNNRPNDYLPDGTLDTRNVDDACVLGFTGEASNVVYAMSNAFHRIYRSDDYGQTWYYYADGPTQMKGFDRQVVFDVSKTDEDIIYTIMNDGHMIVFDGERWYKTNVLDMTGFTQGNMVRSIATDPHDGNVVYCSTLVSGTPNVFMSIDGGGTWKDISEDMPKIGAMILKVNPWTRELYAGTHIGTWIYKTDLPEPGTTTRVLPTGDSYDNVRGGYVAPVVYVPSIELEPNGVTSVDTTNLEMYWNFQDIADGIVKNVANEENDDGALNGIMVGGDVIQEDIIGDDFIDSKASGEGVRVSPMAYGHSIYLNDVGERVYLETSNQTLTDEMTLNISFKMAAIEVEGQKMAQNLISKAKYCYPFGVGVDGWGRPYATIRTTSGTRRLESSQRINYDQWATVSLVVDHNEAILYVRGAETARISDLEGVLADSSSEIILGSVNDSMIDCYVDEVSLFSEALSQEDIIELSYYGPIKPLAQAEEEKIVVEVPQEDLSGLVARYEFPSEGLRVDANEEWFELSETDFQISDALTVVSTFEAEVLTDNQVLIQRGKYCYPFGLTLLKNGGIEAKIRTTEGTKFIQSCKTTILQNEVNTVAMTYELGTLRLYINGVLVGEQEGIEGELVQKELPTFAVSFEGNTYDSNNIMVLHDLRIYNECLSAERIALIEQ